MRGSHPQTSCMKRTIDQMVFDLEKNNITLLNSSRKNHYGENIEDHDERCHTLKVGCWKTPAVSTIFEIFWIIEGFGKLPYLKIL